MKKSTLLIGILLLTLLTTSKNLKAQQITYKVLNPHQVSLASISALTAVGDIDNLTTEINIGLDVGLTINEVKESMVQLYAYCGFPRSLNAIASLREVLEQRRKKGIVDVMGKDDNPVTDTSGRYEIGRKVLEQLTQTPQAKPAPGFGEFAPRIDAFLNEHLFADIFASQVLSFRQREFVTISALAAMKGTGGQLLSHLSMGINVGVTEAQLNELFSLIGEKISRQQAQHAKDVFAKLKAMKK
ncbi:carboxymuconolactone decarboxylase family protein [Pedobacter sp. Leaf176]|uniref:carboxymuconolactone decarboxylase family protein n=1 Tax=Pedobacter sp. Leaf176 TaxID=1736286 RepID=UPI0006FB28D8|nr:carboxymuconolactone decarboxylase family protein [Pedobacter sp. Leaf176]KQR66974.1 hypothetical protein ASF92_19700 [Pedobacter sp. Leaf176]